MVIRLYSLCYTLHMLHPCELHCIPVNYLFNSWKCAPRGLLHLFHHTPTTLLSGDHPLLLYIYESVSVLFCLFFCFFYIPHISEIIWCSSFSVWLISLSIILSRFIHVVTNARIHSFLGLNNIPLYVYLHVYIYIYIFIYRYIYIYAHHTFFILSFIDRHLSCFYILAIVNMLQWT